MTLEARSWKTSKLLPFLLSAAYFIIIHWTMGLRPEHLILAGFLLTSYYLHPKSRRFVIDFLPMVVFGVIYDFLRIFPKEWAGPIHVTGPHALESALFGFVYGGRRMIPSDFFIDHHLAVLDIAAGLAYSLHMAVPIAFAFWIWRKDPKSVQHFNQAFFIVNLLAFVTYIAFPSAPPWYVVRYGLSPASWSVPPDPSGLARFDSLLGFPYFRGVYAKNAWVFGAIPSMHGGFPFLVLWFARKVFPRAVIPLIAYMLLIWFSAVYLGHHYVIDLMAGVLYVLAALILLRLLQSRRPRAGETVSS